MSTSSTSKNNSANSAIVLSYLEGYPNHSYRNFLKVFHDEVITSTLLNASTPSNASIPLNDWCYFDNFWANQFLNTARLQLDKENYISLKEKIKSERKGKGLHTYWQGIIEECRGKRKRNMIEEMENSQPQAKKKPFIISLPEVVRNTLPNLNYLNLRNKSNSCTESTELRFPDEIVNWTGFEQEVLAWQPEVDKEYQKPTFSQRRIITCEKDICTASDINIYETLTPLDQSILFLDGRALKSIVGQPDFIIVNSNMEKEIKEGPYVCSNNNASIFDSINQVYGYMCANSLKYGVLSTYDQTLFLKREVVKVEGEDYGRLYISNTIMSASTSPTLLKSVAYIIDLASNDHYSPFLKKPTMTADDTNEDDEPIPEKKDDSEFKYKGYLLPKGPNVITRNQSRRVLGSLDTNVDL
ncbi:hypothetical protein GLOIN_2v1870431 [Rhizophagus irregularis DAOM 181602=DAOM 197198]|uniref:Uncharacterized protein n=2 Tax=Rhizophagus irregularis TaxID=588596 RepID=A0A2P4QLW4_RHIID|nr:hypothetical protein GLOIN_2v1870431 [Rhizophagus irregularis DAOM 181602=DAOM 197198]POG78632.1 hypothetical protein GLOIN_2v1870431 [Rhizophagus irregularis DAOM 181602=DAOM 197198]|eukprot:XP_025185498.1 hypothetical protein GLOIN_2v1870431 [Rhizophagus irregularis DAOM 181602=DAOM 197198]